MTGPGDVEGADDVGGACRDDVCLGRLRVRAVENQSRYRINDAGVRAEIGEAAAWVACDVIVESCVPGVVTGDQVAMGRRIKPPFRQGRVQRFGQDVGQAVEGQQGRADLTQSGRRGEGVESGLKGFDGVSGVLVRN